MLTKSKALRFLNYTLFGLAVAAAIALGVSQAAPWDKVKGIAGIAVAMFTSFGAIIGATKDKIVKDLPDDGGFARLAVMVSFLVSIGIIGAGFYQAGCATTGPGRFVDVVVECGEDAVAKNPTVAANVRTCLLGLTAGGYVQCISLLPFTVDEITCVVAELSRGAAKAVNTGDANPEEYTILRNANDWLKTNHVGIKRAP